MDILFSATLQFIPENLPAFAAKRFVRQQQRNEIMKHSQGIVNYHAGFSFCPVTILERMRAAAFYK